MSDLFELRRSLFIIDLRISDASDTIDYIQKESSLYNSILDAYGEFHSEMQCKIAWFHFENEVRHHASEVYFNMKKEGSFDLKNYFSKLFDSLFPVKDVQLYVTYKKFSQKDLSLKQYGLKFQLLCEKMGLDLSNEKVKFIMGISDVEIRDILLRTDLSFYDIPKLISYGYGLMDTLSMARESGNIQEGGGIKEEEKGKSVSSKALALSTEYFKLAQKKKLDTGKCYNCFKVGHNCLSCPHKYCKFCKGKTNGAGHFSLACRKCPSKL